MPSLRRTFRRWFSEGCGQKLSKGYYAFIGECGHVLEDVTSSRGHYPGEIDRCFWGALGEQNFLHKMPQSRFKSFMLEEEGPSQYIQPLLRYYQCFRRPTPRCEASELVRITKYCLKRRLADVSCRENAAADLNFRCELWDLARRRPRLQKSQAIIIPRSNWTLYDSPTWKKCFGRPVPVSPTSDLQFLRIGSSVFTWSENFHYCPINIFGDGDDYFEDMASSERYLAVSTRQQAPQRHLITALDSSSALHEEVLAVLMEQIKQAKSKPLALEDQPSIEDRARRILSRVDLRVRPPSFPQVSTKCKWKPARKKMFRWNLTQM